MALVLEEDAGEIKQIVKEKQELRDLSLDMIAPMWSWTLRERKRTQLPLDLGDYGCCIVGEAHGFTNKYIVKGFPEFCPACIRYAAAFGVYSNVRKSRDRILHVAKGFVEHFNETHKEDWYAKYASYK